MNQHELEEKRNEQREHVLDYAFNEFIQKGLKAVKMNDIAFALSMSKRTLYEMFEDKEGLLIECMKLNHKRGREEFEKLRKESSNSLETFTKFYRKQLQDLRRVNPAFLSDIQKYEKVMAYLEESSREKNEFALRFTQECVENGLFRNDVNFELALSTFDIVARAMLSNEFYMQYGFENIIHTINLTFVRGLCTLKGLEIIDSEDYFLKMKEDVANSQAVENSND